MSKQANKTMIGVFVLGALVLVVVGILIFGSGEFLKEKVKVVMFFEGSVKGLDIGAPVTIQGVKVGTVTDIVLRGHMDEFVFDIPVFVEIEPDRITRIKKGPHVRDPEKILGVLVEKGLRASLKTQSIVTGKMMIELDFHPNKPIRLRAEEGMGYPEIPTVPTALDELAGKLERLPIGEVFKKIKSTVEGIEKVVNSPEVMAALKNLNSSLEAAHGLIENIDQQVEPLAASADRTMGEARKLLTDVDQQVDPLTNHAGDTMKAAETALEQARMTLKTIENTVDENLEVFYDLTQALDSISSAARSVSVLTDYMSRHPESLVRGKGGSR